MEIAKPYLLFFGDAPDDLAAKTSIGVFEWCPDDCVGQIRLPGCVPRVDLPELDIADAVARGARTVLVGVVNRGGVISDSWAATLVEALENGMDLASGLHTRLSSVPAIVEAAKKHGRQLHDVRHFDGNLPIGTGNPRSGRRLLTVGTDCSVGKMYTALAIHRELLKQGVRSDFKATGQTGIFIAGNGISVDAVVADFISGAIEELCPSQPDDHWDLVEGQGSLFHPSYAGVSLGLLHGAQPDSLVLCHEPTRTHMRGLPNQSLPSLRECMDANLAAAKIVRDDARFVGIAVNTRALDAQAANACLSRIEDELGLPCVDPVRTGVERIVEGLV
jgi:uncharacterized NAD-dependent epimerase/dehydratase family protein